MKIVIAPDKFKDSLSAIEVCDNLIEGLSNESSNFDYISCPMADGGEGSLEILNYYLDLEQIDVFESFFNCVLY